MAVLAGSETFRLERMLNVIRGGAGWQELGLDFRRPRSASESAPHFEAFTNKVFARCKFCQPNQKT